MNTTMKENKETIILGDFNINYNEPSDKSNFKSAINQFGFKQMVNKSTRVTNTSSTLIDLIMTNNPSTLSHVNAIATSLSDHDMVACIRKLNTQRYEPKTIKARNYSNYDAAKMKEDVSKIDWGPIYQTRDVSSALLYFCNQLKTVFNEHAPFVEKRVKGKNCPWLNQNVRKSMKERDKLLRKARKSKTLADWTAYK